MRGWMIAAVSMLVASGAWAGLRVGTERAPEPKVVPVVVEGGIGFSEPIDTEGYSEAAFLISESCWEGDISAQISVSFYCQLELDGPRAKIHPHMGFTQRGTNGSRCYSDFNDLRCPWLLMEQSLGEGGEFADTLGYIYLK